MANIRLAKTLVNVDKRSHDAFVHIHEQAKLDKNDYVVAHCQGAIFAQNGISSGTRAMIGTLQKQLESDDMQGAENASARASITDMIADLQKTDWQSVGKYIDAIVQKGENGARPKLADDTVIYCPFASDGCHYLFAHVNHTQWSIITFNMVTRHASELAKTADVKGKIDGDSSVETDSPSRARQYCATFHKPIGENKTGIDSLVAGINNSNGLANCGGVGENKKTKKSFGKYALVLKGVTARALIKLVRDKSLVPGSFTYVDL